MTDRNHGPMADFVDAIHAHWWHSKTPPIPGHNIGRDLSIVKRWLKQGWGHDELLGGMKLYDGNPVTLRVTEKKGFRQLINRLVGDYHKNQAVKGTRVGAILRQLAEESDT